MSCIYSSRILINSKWTFNFRFMLIDELFAVWIRVLQVVRIISYSFTFVLLRTYLIGKRPFFYRLNKSVKFHWAVRNVFETRNRQLLKDLFQFQFNASRNIRLQSRSSRDGPNWSVFPHLVTWLKRSSLKTIDNRQKKLTT